MGIALEENPAEGSTPDSDVNAEKPAAVFDEVAGDVTVHVEAPEGAFPAGTIMMVEPVAEEQVIDAVQEAVEESVTKVSAVDIIFLDTLGNEIEPEAEIRVSMSSSVMENVEQPVIVHVDEEGVAETVESEQVDGSVVFESDRFSVYVLVETETITVPFVAGDGTTYEVTVTYGDDAGIPAGSTMVVSELTAEREEYQKYLEQTAEAIGTASDELDYLKILDISIVNGGETVTIQAPVKVEIKLLDKEAEENPEGEKTRIIHFGEITTDVIEPELNGTIVKFEAEGFSYYAVTTYGATADLDGKSFAIVQVNTQAEEVSSVGNNTVYQGRALTTNATNNKTRLSGATVSVETHESGLNLVSSGTTQIVEWEFESTGGTNTYYIKSPNGQYLNIANNKLSLSNTPQQLIVTAGTGTNAGKVRIAAGAANNSPRLQSSVSAANATVSNTQYFTAANQTDANYIYMTLCEIREFSLEGLDEFSGEKISVNDLVDGQKYLIYKNIYNEITDQYEDWIIDGNGNPVRAYDQGDSLSLYSGQSPWWVLHICTDTEGQPTGYYIFRNEATGLCLCPQADGTLVAAYESDNTSGVALAGRERGEYTSTIEKWDDSAMHWYGYEITTEGEVLISSVTGSASQAFSFAEEKISQSGLHPVPTVDSTASGITIRMFDYGGWKDRRNQDSHSNTWIDTYMGSTGYTNGDPSLARVSETITNGFPVFTNSNNSASTLFGENSDFYVNDGNHLFLESVYNSTGYYEYSAFNNFAHYDKNTGEFTVYQETGTPSTTGNNFFYKRGNFLPYNSLNTNNSIKNIYTGDGVLIDYENPNYGSTLYGLSGTTNYYFGMTMDFHFLMPKDGKVNETPMIYEFNGDDDLWIYIDDVLVLDIGGVHDAIPGSINFETGEIVGVGAGGATTIKGCFKNAGVFPDGTPWQDSRVNEYFDGDTFVDYGGHKFNMFYMEHGAGASNLQMRFNLPVIEKGKVTVEKKLDNTSQVDYANVSFAYQIFAKNEHGQYESLNSAVYEGKTDSSGNPVPINFYNNVLIDGKSYDNVFYLKPKEAAVFSDLIDDETYYVQEIGIRNEYYDEIFVNDVEIDGETAHAQDGVYRSSEATVRNRARVTFSNHCDERNSNELLITKRLAEGTTDNGDTFEFRVLLENASGQLSAYYQGVYYIRDDEGIYYKYQNGQLTPNGMTEYALTAGNNGTISQIPPNYTVVIKDLVAGTDFFVDEIRVRKNGTTSDVLLANSDWILKSTDISECDEAEIKDVSIYDYATGSTKTVDALGSIAWGKDAQAIFTNKVVSADVQLKKVKEDGETTISGSSFELSTYGTTWTTVQTSINPGEPATSTDPAVPNPVNLGELSVGRYRLTETKPPNGYIILSDSLYFEVYKDTDGVLKARLTDEYGTAANSPTDTASIEGPGNGDTPIYTITVKNTPGKELPHTGGSGTLPYTLGGIVLIMASALMYGFRMRRRERRLNNGL